MRQTAQIVKAIETAAMSVVPAWLKRITSHQIPAGKFKAPFGIRDVWAVHLPEHIGLTAARGARTLAAQKLELKIGLRAIVPTHRQFAADLLNIP